MERGLKPRLRGGSRKWDSFFNYSWACGRLSKRGFAESPLFGTGSRVSRTECLQYRRDPCNRFGDHNSITWKTCGVLISRSKLTMAQLQYSTTDYYPLHKENEMCHIKCKSTR
ncbi:hypothetical protein NDU88_003428 [Pleurodeles waltl]|uniref:Uncharacterized protein n=1 Tax=Pleurodeles waltl TaxID=8319 RepID=A0AAV7TPS1_PLEWA|nr:hypothetical protein NDU88_003428 [Pleurodeles waltl]